MRSVAEDYTDPVTLTCAEGDSITAIEFGSWGTPSGACLGSGSANTFAVNASCAFDGTAAVLAGLCVGRSDCTFTPSDALFGGADPCDKVEKWLAAAVTCAAPSGVVRTPTATSVLDGVNVTAWQLTCEDRLRATRPVRSNTLP